jgi:hypothetical protein
MTRVALASLLAAWWWAIGVVLGCFANAWMHVLTGGAWGAPVRATALVLGRRLPWLLLGFGIPIAAMTHLYPWAMQPRAEWAHAISRPNFTAAWLSPGFFVARMLVYAAVWWLLTRPASLASKGRAAASLVAYAVSTTLAAVDVVMSLMPGWYSTAFGLVVMSTQMLSGAAAVVLLAIARAPREWPSAGRVPVTRDLGNLLLTWCMGWGYLAFMQFLVIWAENIPREIQWFVPRLQTGWQWIALVLIAVQLAIPFVLLLFRRIKDNPRRLAMVALLLLGATALDSVWLVLPSVEPHDLNAWWAAPLAFGVAALLLFGRLGKPHDDAFAERFGHA